MGNVDAWASEEADNYISVWGVSFNDTVQLDLELCNDPSGVQSSVVFRGTCTVISSNELQVKLSSLPPSGIWWAQLVPTDGPILPANTWQFGEDYTISVIRLESFFPLFGEIAPRDPEMMSIVTDSPAIDVLKPSFRWKATNGPYDISQADVSIDQGRIVCSIPSIKEDPSFPLNKTIFNVFCTVDSHSARVYGNPGEYEFSMKKTAIWRSVDPHHTFQFITVQSVSPLYAGPGGGEAITITFSGNIRQSLSTSSALGVLFGDQPGIDAKWASDNSIIVLTPILPASPTVQITVTLDQEQFPFSGFSVYDLISVNPSFGIQSSQPLHVMGNYLPLKPGTITYSIQSTGSHPSAPSPSPTPGTPASPGGTSPGVPSSDPVAQAEVASARATKALEDNTKSIAAYQAQLATLTTQANALNQQILALANTTTPDPMTRLQEAAQAGKLLEVIQKQITTISTVLAPLQAAEPSLQANARNALAAIVAAKTLAELRDSASGKAGSASTASQAHVALPSFLPTTSKTSLNPKPTSVDFWFYLPRALDASLSYDIWYCPQGNTSMHNLYTS